ncbi:MAG: M14 family metallopeptidase, partial [bacterium]
MRKLAFLLLPLALFFPSVAGNTSKNADNTAGAAAPAMSQLKAAAGPAGILALNVPEQADLDPLNDLDNDPRRWITVKASNREERTALATAGMSIEEIDKNTVSGIATPHALELITGLGFEIPYNASLAEYARSLADRDFPPQDAAYHNYGEMLKVLKDLEKKNPELVSLFSMGKSVENRDIWALRLNPSLKGEEPDTRPGAFFTGNHHAREHLSVEVPLLFAVYLCENKTKPEVKKLLETLDIFIAPMINPDGAEYDIATGQYRWQRKNMRLNYDKTIGVDLNRNYGYGWGGQGASSYPGDDTYRGPNAFSEPETQAVREFVEARDNIKTLITYHSYSELILYPWGRTYDPVSDKKDLETYKILAGEMAKLTGYTPKQSSGLYITSGDTTDWTYGTKGIFSFTIELTPTRWGGGGFYPGVSVIGKTVADNIKAAMYLLSVTDNPY